MFSSQIDILKLCKNYIEANFDSRVLRNNENNLKNFSSYLIRDDNDNYIISDNEYSIKCILEENFTKNFLGANEIIEFGNLNNLLIAVNQLNNISINIVIYLKEFHIAMETEINNNYQENQKPNINRNKLINEALRNFLAQLSLSRSKTFFDNTSILKGTNFKEKNYLLNDVNETPTDNSNQNIFELFDKIKGTNRAIIINENIEIPKNKGLIECEEELKSNENLKPLSDFRKKQEELNLLLNADYKTLFYKQPTQLKIINKNKLKANKEMENLMEIEDIQANPEEAIKIENDEQLINKKRKESDGLSEIRKDLIEQMPSEIKAIIDKFNKSGTFDIDLLEKYRFYKKYGTMNVKLLK